LLLACQPIDGPGLESDDSALASGEPDLPASVEAALHAPAPPAWADRLFTVDHEVPTGDGGHIHVRETFNLRAWFRRHRRAVLMLPGPLTTGEFFNIDVDGYRDREGVASRGVFAFTADFEGTGGSSFPADGGSATQARQVALMRRVVRYIRWIRGVRRVDVLGESWGGGVAAELCSDRRRVRSCVLASMLYQTPSDFALATFLDPGFRAFLESLPNAYLPTDPSVYLRFTPRMTPEVAAWTDANMPGQYSVAPLLDVFSLPFFDATGANVPGLLIQGELDENQDVADSMALAADYGGGMELIVIAGAGHVPRTEPAAHDVYWDAVFEFWGI